VRILLTGGTGFIGSHALPGLSERHEIVALTRRTPPPELVELADWIVADLADPLPVAALPRRVDAVIHLAQSERYREFPEGAGDIVAVNLTSTAALLEYARTANASRFVLASSGGVYVPASQPVSESAAVAPPNFYLTSKYAAELLLRGYSSILHTIALRFFFVYGPGQTRQLVPTLVDKVVRGELIEIEGEPGLRINPVYVEDAVRVLDPVLSLERGGVFNVAGSEEVTVGELVKLISEAVCRPARVAHRSAASDGDLVADITLMRSALGVAPAVGLREGLSAAVSALGARSG
jgi:UDP-glucose 4-epimerase